MKKFQFESPNYTQTPNDFFDHLLKKIADMSELKVTLTAIRMTIGYHQEEAELSQEYLMQATGMARNSVRRGLALALRRGTIVIKRKSTVRTGGIYSLNVRGSASDPLEGQPLVSLEGQPVTPLKKERKKEIFVPSGTTELPIEEIEFAVPSVTEKRTPEQAKASVASTLANPNLGLNANLSTPQAEIESLSLEIAGVMGYTAPTKSTKSVANRIKSKYPIDFLEKQFEKYRKTRQFMQSGQNPYFLDNDLEHEWQLVKARDELVMEFAN